MNKQNTGAVLFNNGFELRAAWVAVVSLALSGPAFAAAFPPEVALSDLLPANGGDGSLGTILNGVAANDRSGMSVAHIGDINSDGIDDVIVGAFQASPGGTLSAGESYVVFGRATPPAEFDLAGLATGGGTDGFVVRGIAPGDFSGEEVAGGADLNADGIDDVVIGAGFADGGGLSEAGETYVIYGRDALTPFPAVIDLSSLPVSGGGDGSVGSVIRGALTGDFAGRVSAGGDFNDDNVDDLLIGAERADPGGRVRAGETYVVFGRAGGFGAEFDLASLKAVNGGDGSEGVVMTGINAFDESGTSVDNAGDVNADNIDDILIGAPIADSTGLPFAGEAYLLFGRSSFPAEIALSSLLPGNGGDGTSGIILYGEQSNAETGSSVSGGSDVNDDGIGDIVIGASLIDAGRSYVVFGKNTPFNPTFLLSSLTTTGGGDGSQGFVVNGIVSGDLAGRVVGDLGDFNNDGIGDIGIGAFLASPGGVDRAGSTYVVFGDSGGFPAEIDLDSLLAANGGDGSAGVVINGIDANDGSGIDISAAGDFNMDGIDDIAIGADTADPNGQNSAGETYVVYGRADTGDPDGDGDGVPDATDNCVTVPNNDQADGDADGVGDACDNCVEIANADQYDSNGDDIGSLCDADVTGPDAIEDCTVNFLDLQALKDAFFSNPASPTWNPDADFDNSGLINFVDLQLVKDQFFGSPGPSAAGCDAAG